MADETIVVINNLETVQVQPIDETLVVKVVEDAVQADLAEQIVSVKMVEEILQLPSGSVEVGPPQTPGRRPFIDLLAVPGQQMVIDCNKALTFRLDAAALSLASPLQIDIINVPPGVMAMIYILVANVPVGGCAIIWPAAAGLSNTPVGPGLSNEYEVRSWDAGVTMHIKRTAYYKVV